MQIRINKLTSDQQLIEAMSLSELATRMEATMIGEEAQFAHLSTDTRTLQAGDAYLALKGEHFDGHEFVAAAEQAGASALIVEREQQTTRPQLLVPDTHVALGDIARLNRQRSSATVLALTGSQGKTTVKEMTASILADKAETLATIANLNNTIGVPLTLLRIEPQHTFVVIEMGANKAGEIAFSVSVTQPDVALITNANAAHVEGFGSLQGIVEAKGEILDALSADGVAVLNADDPNVEQWQARASQCKQLTFSVRESGEADFSAKKIEVNSAGKVSFCLSCAHGEVDIQLPLLGKHNVSNAMAAATAAMAAGAGLENVKAGLEKVRAVSGRLNELAGLAGSVLIDDSYNASPASFFAAIDVLAQSAGQQILIVGDMKELGDESEESHRQVGRYAAKKNIDQLWVTGEFASTVATAFGNSAQVFQEKEHMLEAARDIAAEGVVFLVKGSRGSQMETIVSALRAEGEG